MYVFIANKNKYNFRTSDLKPEQQIAVIFGDKLISNGHTLA